MEGGFLGGRKVGAVRKGFGRGTGYAFPGEAKGGEVESTRGEYALLQDFGLGVEREGGADFDAVKEGGDAKVGREWGGGDDAPAGVGERE